MRIKELKLNQNSICYIIFFIICVIPFFRYYDIPGINLSIETILKIILLIFCLALQITTKEIKTNSINHNSSRYFILFCIWFLLITAFYELFTDINIFNSYSDYTISTFLMLFPTIISIFIILKGKFNSNSFFSIYEKFVYITIAVYLIQWLLMITNHVISFKIPFLTYTKSWSYLDNIIFGMNSRPTSLFSEPAHICEFLLPYIAINLYSNIYKNNFFKSLLVTFIVITTVSGNGIVVALIEWVCYFFIYGKMNKTTRFFAALFSIVAFVSIYNYLLTIPSFDKMFSELFVNTTGKYTHTKADYRVYRGFDYYFKLPFSEKITGVGYQHMYTYANLNNISSIYDSSIVTFEFFSTITQILLYSGFIGFYLFIMHLYQFWKGKNNLTKVLIISSVALWLSSQMLFANTFLMYIAFIVASQVEYNRRLMIENE